MTKQIVRDYPCKDEELSVICGFIVYSITRDLLEFTGYSHKFNQAYITDYVAKIVEVKEVIMPAAETLKHKDLTKNLNNTMHVLIDLLNRLTGYLEMLDTNNKISPVDFGIVSLRNSLYKKDAEGVIGDLKTVIANIDTYETVLTEQGLTPELTGMFTAASISIDADNLEQYKTISKRAIIVQSNIELFNSLYKQLVDIMNVGKILYKGKDAAKTKEYTFTSLKKRVHYTSKPATDAPVDPIVN